MKKLFVSLAALSLLYFPALASNPTGTANQVLRIPSTGGLAKYGPIDLSKFDTVGATITSVSNGGTGVNVIPQAGIVIGNGTLAVVTLSPGGTAGNIVYTSDGVNWSASAPPVLAAFNNYRRPRLVFSSTTEVDVENNSTTSNQTTILFPDGQMRSVTENLGSTQVYRAFKTGQNAAWASGTIQGGIRSGAVAANTWYALYAVKCTKAGETANFVIVGDTVLPTQANYATLNSNFGVNGWSYLGLIRYGDNASATTSVLAFTQQGALTMFSNSTSGANVYNMPGIREGTTAGAGSTTWTYAAGTTNLQLPNNVLTGVVGAAFICNVVTQLDCDSAGSNGRRVSVSGGADPNQARSGTCNLSNGFGIFAASGICQQDLFLEGFWDLALGGTSTPYF